MKIIVTADDYGLTRGVTDTILVAVDHGAVNCVSLVANGDDFNRAVEEAKKRPEMQIALHLNLTDGKPVAEIFGSELLNGRGEFYLLFQTIWSRHVLSSRKQQLFDDVKKEIRAQVKKIQQALPGRTIFLNGHDHVHMIPFVVRAVADVADELELKYVRISDEPFFIVPTQLVQYFSANPLKWLLLKLLSIYARRCMKGKRVQTTDTFVGLLFTGTMTVDVVRAAFKKITSQTQVVEVLFHPGKADKATEADRWPEGGRTPNWFFSPDRDREGSEACKPELKQLIGSKGV